HAPAVPRQDARRSPPHPPRRGRRLPPLLRGGSPSGPLMVGRPRPVLEAATHGVERARHEAPNGGKRRSMSIPEHQVEKVNFATRRGPVDEFIRRAPEVLPHLAEDIKAAWRELNHWDDVYL